MTLSLIAIAVLSIVVLAFVLEPILRARGDAVVLDSAALPRSEPELLDDVGAVEDAPVDPAPAAHRPPVPHGIEPRAAGDPT
ncbi:MAG: hypothetical protein DCC58_08105 [Chloroflexi bacterium]|nr:MAG: hypothetical protein DCC58_08105 [Chloroflexota bacterium]